MMGLDVSHDLPAAHTLARIALSNNAMPGWEGALPMILARTRSLEMLPYLMVMLDSPTSSPRDATLMAFCQLLGPMAGGKPDSFWQREMSDYCPHKSPIGDREEESRDLAFWKNWYTSKVDEIRRVANLPQVVMPARYSMPSGLQEMTEVPMEERFYAGVVSIAMHTADHSHDASGAIQAGPPPRPFPDLVLPKLFRGDPEIYQREVAAVSERLAALQKRATDLMNAARLNGGRPDQAAFTPVERRPAGGPQSGAG